MRRSILFLCVVTACGCIGVRFNDVALNPRLPENFKNRNLYNRTDQFRFKMTELAGSMLFKDGATDNYRRGSQVLRDGYRPVLEAIKDEERGVYSAKIDKAASAQGSYLGLISAELAQNAAADVRIEDVSLVFISGPDVPMDKLAEEAAKPKGTATSRYWVQGVLLASIKVTNYSEISSKASGVQGDTFGASGKVYNRQGEASTDWKISLELIDIDQLASTPAAVMSDFVAFSIAMMTGSPTNRTETVWQPLRPRAIVIRSIEDTVLSTP